MTPDDFQAFLQSTIDYRQHLDERLDRYETELKKLSKLLIGNGEAGALEKLRNLPCALQAEEIREIKEDLKPLQHAYLKMVGGATVLIFLLKVFKIF